MKLVFILLLSVFALAQSTGSFDGDIAYVPDIYLLNSDHISRVVQGFLEGAGSEVTVDQIIRCVKTGSLSSGLASGITQLALKDTRSIQNGLTYISKTLAVIPEAIVDCKLSEEEESVRLSFMLKAFNQPSSIIFRPGKDLIINGVQVYDDIKGAFLAYEKKDFQLFAYDVARSLSQIASSSLEVYVPKTYLLVAGDVLKVLIGVLEGIGAEANATHIVPCIKDSYTISGKLASAIQDFVQKDEAHIKEGLKLLGEAIEAFPDAMTECQVAVSEAKRLYQMIANFKSPSSFAWHLAKDLIVNGVQIFKDISDAQKAYQAKSWETFGFDVGHALAEVLLGTLKITIKTPDVYLIDENQLKLIFEGILEGVGAETNATDIAPCIKDSLTVSSLLGQAIQDFAQKDEEHIKEGLKLLGEAIESLPDAMTECKAAAPEIERIYQMIANFKSPSSFIWHVTKDLIVNGVQIYKDINAALQAYQGQSWEPFGYDVGHALAEVFLGSTFNKTIKTPKTFLLDINQIEEIFLGVLEGVSSEANATDIVPCLKDADTISALFAQAIQDFAQKDEADIKEGLKLLGEAIEKLPDAMTECQAAASEVERIYQMIANFKSPTSFVWHVAEDLIVNGVQIYKDITAAEQAYASQSWESFGYDVGHALAEVFLGSSNIKIITPNVYLLDINQIEQILLGVLEGIGSQANATDIVPCIKDTATISSLLGQAVLDFAQKDEDHVKEGLKLLGEAIESLPDAMTECQAAVQEAEKLYQMIANFKSPSSFAWHLAEDLIVNGVQIYKDIEGAIQSYQAQSWETFGFDVGHALAEVFIGASSSESIEKTPDAYLLNTDQILKIFLGVLEGVGAEANATDIAPCVKDTVTVSGLFAGAIQDFAKGDEESVKEGLLLLGQAIEALPDAMTECQAAVPEAERLYEMIANFKSPSSFIWHVAKDLIVNGVQIFKDITAAQADYQAQSWEPFGYDVGHALAEVFLGAPSKIVGVPHTYLITIDEVEKIFLGVIEGIGAEANMTDILPCLTDAETVSSLLAQAIVDFAAGDEDHVKAGLKLLGEAIEKLPDAMTECRAAVSEAETIYEMIKNFKSPISFAWHVAKDLIVNGVQIYSDIDGAIQAYDSQNWQLFGYDAGHALAEVFIGLKEKTSLPKAYLIGLNEIEQIFLGIIEGAGAEANITALAPCITDVSSISGLLAEAIQEFAQNNESSIKEGLKLLGLAIESLPEAMTQCQEAVSQAERLYAMIKNFQSPTSFAWHVAKDLIVNGVQIYEDIKGAIDAYDAQNWEKFGYDAGHALAEVLVGSNVRVKSFLEK